MKNNEIWSFNFLGNQLNAQSSFQKNIHLSFDENDSLISGEYITGSIQSKISSLDDDDYTIKVNDISLRYSQYLLDYVNICLSPGIEQHNFRSNYLGTCYIFPDFDPNSSPSSPRNFLHATDLFPQLSWKDFSYLNRHYKINTPLVGPASESFEIICCPKPKYGCTLLGINREISVYSPEPKIKELYGSNRSILVNLPNQIGNFIKKPDKNSHSQIIAKIKALDSFIQEMNIQIN